MTRVKLGGARQGYQSSALPLVQSGNGKAARMTISVAAGRKSVDNDRWSKTLQLYSDYFIRY